jgi:pyridinium-3,5-bisthiocarboxylic acid mononucleotide nickel chelatase
MKILYFDCFAGVSGHMLLAALCDVGVDPNLIVGLPRRLKMPYLETAFVTRACQSLRGLELGFPNADGSGERTLGEIMRIISAADVSAGVKSSVGRAYSRLAIAEARVHDSTPDEVHFHEVGYDQAVIGVTGFYVALEALGFPRVYSSPLVMGCGLARAAHGLIPLPGPAVMEIVKGLPIRLSDHEGETVTPTGAALLAETADFGPCPEMIVSAVGYGVGANQGPDRLNMVRAVLGESCG